MISKKVAGTAFAILMMSVLTTTMAITTVNACAGPGLSPGFWKHNVGVCLGLRNGAYSDPVNSPVVSQDNMGTWLHEHWTDAELRALYNDLNTQGGGAAGAATRVAAANVFNEAADLFDYQE
ncbi:hypothetical protein MUP77_17005 [Candidatus Bathyarchaeota archaeon]|nr:hypothetical protein [Candidatus Bathyarchaeota archaeon]